MTPLEGVPQVALEDVAHEDRILLRQRLVQAPIGFHYLPLLVRGFEGQQRIRGVPGDPGQSKHKYAHGPECHDCPDSPYEYVSLHGTPFSLLIPSLFMGKGQDGSENRNLSIRREWPRSAAASGLACPGASLPSGWWPSPPSGLPVPGRGTPTMTK